MWIRPFNKHSSITSKVRKTKKKKFYRIDSWTLYILGCCIKEKSENFQKMISPVYFFLQRKNKSPSVLTWTSICECVACKGGNTICLFSEKKVKFLKRSEKTMNQPLFCFLCKIYTQKFFCLKCSSCGHTCLFNCKFQVEFKSQFEIKMENPWIENKISK